MSLATGAVADSAPFTGRSVPPADAGPITSSERLTLIDALRGFALAGVFMVNTGVLTLWGYLSKEQRAALPSAEFDRWAQIALGFFAHFKFLTLFSLLFGLGFAVQLMRNEERGGDVGRPYVRRLLVLLAIGLAHSLLVWWGDILRFYAILGFALIVFRRASPRVLLWTGLALCCVGSAVLTPIVEPLWKSAVGPLPTWPEAGARVLPALSGDSYTAVFRNHVWFDAWYLASNWYEPLGIIGRFLLGFWAGRMLLFHRPMENRALLVRIFVGSAVLGIAGNAAGTLQTHFGLITHIPALAHPAGRAALDVLTSTGYIALATAYATGFALLFLKPSWRRRLEVLAPVGRMALTNYLTQSLICVGVFYGIGLGVGPRFGIPGRLVVVALVFGAQIAFSRWWLARYRFGPAEWVWRSLTYGRRQPMRVGGAAS